MRRTGWRQPLEAGGNKQAAWRTDPERSGVAGAVGDIGTHAFHLAEFVTGVRVTHLAADLSAQVPGRRLDDNAQMMLRFGERRARRALGEPGRRRQRERPARARLRLESRPRMVAGVAESTARSRATASRRS